MCISCIHICYGFVLCIFRNIYKMVLSGTLYTYFIFGLGNIEDALQKIKRFVCSKSSFLEAFIEEGLKFTSSLYLMLIWIRVLRFVLENPEEVNKQMVNVPYFGVSQNAYYKELYGWSCKKYVQVTDSTKTRNTQGKAEINRIARLGN